MAAMRGPRLQVGSAAWIAEERASALQIAQSEVEEFSYSARNELDWLNEHVAGIFDENEMNIAETFKTPGKLRGKTPRTARKGLLVEARVPLSDVFSATPNGSTNRFAQQLNRLQSPRPQANETKIFLSPRNAASPKRPDLAEKEADSGPGVQDSGYHGSQDIDSMDIDEPPRGDRIAFHQTMLVPLKQTPSQTVNVDSPEKTFQTAKEEQTTRILAEAIDKVPTPKIVEVTMDVKQEQQSVSAASPSTCRKLASPSGFLPSRDAMEEELEIGETGTPGDDVRSPSDGSSPIRQMVRKSSLNFASLPAREPLAAGKSTGARVSRTSHLDHNRTSYYNRQTGGKSLGNPARYDDSDDEDQDDMDVDDVKPPKGTDEPITAVDHNKTYTQRLQDQINMLGKSQPNASRPSKSIPATQRNATTAPQSIQDPKSPSPTRREPTKTTPGAFPEDTDDDEWIEPPAAVPPTNEISSPRPTIPKSYSADVMEGIRNKDTVGGADFMFPNGHQDTQLISPQHGSAVRDRMPNALGHSKSASISAVPTGFMDVEDQLPLQKAITIPNSKVVLSERDPAGSPSKSPARAFRDSPLRQVKNKLSSILKSSRGLLASSAAISAEGKSSMLSPSAARLGFHVGHSSESVVPKPNYDSQNPKTERDTSPARPAIRRTRASAEREKEEKRREKEAKQLADQMDKLDKAREKEREKARVFSKEQEKMAALERQVASKKDVEKLAPKETPKPTRSSPRKGKAIQDDGVRTGSQDVEMHDAPPTMPPPSVPRSAGASQATRNKEIKRPLKPAKEPQSKIRQAPTVIRVNTGSQHSQYHPPTGTLPASGQDNSRPSSANAQAQLVSKTGKPSLHNKSSAQSLKNSVSSSGRPKVLDLAAKKKEQDEREAQRRRDAKVEMERKRAATQEDQRKQEQQRRQEMEPQKQKDREQNAMTEAKKNAQRQAAIEKAKQTRAPPPVARSQPNGPPDYNSAHELHATATGIRTDGQPARPPSRMQSGVHRPHDEQGKPVNAVLSNASKAVGKRPLGQESNDDSRSRGGPTYQAKDAKRRRTSDSAIEENEVENPPNIKGPPVRPSAGFKKDLPTKSLFQNGYSNAPQSVTRDLFKATVTAQHNGQVKATHPLDMAQISKGAIPFAPAANPAASAYKTPARSVAPNGAKSTAKSASRSSPRFQNGELIELPEIQTDDEDEDEDETHGMVAAWADSPDLRRALMRQETMDPSLIFGPPAALNMEEVFSKNKEKWHKFRKRTSSANWSGSDRLTEEDIRKDIAARDKLRREGGWSYEMSKDML